MNMIEIEHVSKVFGKTEVLHDINLNVASGSIHGFVGRNGSGKSVLMKCISGLYPVTEGIIRINGKVLTQDIEKPESLGILIEGPGFMEEYSGLWNLEYLFSLTGKPDKQMLKDLMGKVGLDPDNRKPVRKYSTGMKQRLGIAQAIMESPELLILDEPMNGLDNQGVREMRELIRQVNAGGTTICLTSHLPEDIETLCSAVTYLDGGRMVDC